jgi:DNA repair exonuclease SbcCD ATPase subunit
MDDEEPPLPPPPMCFMAKHSKVSDSDSSGSSSSDDDDLSPLAIKGLLDEYTSMIKKQKSKLKTLEETHEKLKLSNDELLVKHNDHSKEHDALVVSNKSLRDDHNKLLDKHNELIVKHDDITVLNKSLESNHKKLKKEHVILEMKCQELELAHEDIGSSGYANAREVTKTNASTSCDDLIEEPKVLLNDENIASSSKTNHDRVKTLEEEVRGLRSCVKTLAKGEELHKKILYYNARDYGTRGLGSFPNPIKETSRSKELYGCFITEVGSYCQHCKVIGHHTRECPTLARPLPTLPNNFKSMYNDNHFLLIKKNNVKFIGAKPKVKPPRSLWILKALVTHIKGPKPAWVHKSQS